MKKVLKLILALAVVFALSLTVLAVSPEESALTVDPAVANIVTSASTDAPAGYEIIITSPTAAGVAANEAAAKATGKDLSCLSSFDIIVKKGGEVVHSGITVNLTLNIGAQYVGKYLNLIENNASGSAVVLSKKINSAAEAVALKSFSTYTIAVTNEPAQGSVSPQTSQTVVTYVLVAAALVAAIGAAYATKRRFA